MHDASFLRNLPYYVYERDRRRACVCSRRRGGGACRHSGSGTTATTAAPSSPRPRRRSPSRGTRRSWRPAATCGSSTRRPRGSHRPPVSRKVRRPAEKSYGGSKRPRAATPARASDGVVPSSVPHTPAKSTGAARAARVVQRVDADLYQVPPQEFVHDDDLRPRVCRSANIVALVLTGNVIMICVV